MASMAQRKRHGRKLLIASIGVAAVSYVACSGDDSTPSTDAGQTTGSSGATGFGGDVVANLVAPPIDSGITTGGGSGEQ
jgi:hypothetical protein